MLNYIMNGGWEGFWDIEDGIYVTTYAIDHIFDMDQVDVLLFKKSNPEGEEMTEENLYIIPAA